MKKEKAITLISLVITIIVLIILASVAIYLSLGNNGIFTRAKQAKEVTDKQTATEIINLKITTAQMNKYAKEQRMPTLKELSEVLDKDDEILYVTETSQIASTKYEVGENPSSIFTKLNEYPYEFEINGQLQLASIDGVKLANENSQNVNQPTGIKWDIWIKNYITATGKYTSKTSMSGLSLAKDTDNKIDEYISYSNEDGYTVLKSGWYFIYSTGNITSSNSSEIASQIVINNKAMGILRLWSANSSCDYDCNSFPIFLTKNEKFYFNVNSNYAATRKDTSIYCYPMF